MSGNYANMFLYSSDPAQMYWEIKNNIFDSPTTYHIFQYPTNPGVDLSIDYNLYYPAMSSTYFYAGGYKTFAQWQALTPSRDANSVVSNPLFVSSSDLHLQSGSPARDAGANVGLVSDYAGAMVPSGNAPDIGAYEYISSSTLPSPLPSPIPSPPSNIIIQ